MRECAVNAIGRNGHAEYSFIVSYWTELFRFASVKDAKVRLSIIWESENIATIKKEYAHEYQSEN